uniref:Uncharacterized protein n=1 Tax=Setaria italica TaxID=4555 RepID=K3Y492_SETIT
MVSSMTTLSHTHTSRNACACDLLKKRSAADSAPL